MNSWETDKEFIATFRAEALERLQCLDEGLMALEKTPADQELIKRLFRDAHTVKGSAGMMGLAEIRDIAHRLEDILAALQKRQLTISRDLIDSLLAGLDRIRALLPAANGEQPADTNIDSMLKRLSAILTNEGSHANISEDAVSDYAGTEPCDTSPDVTAVLPQISLPQTTAAKVANTTTRLPSEINMYPPTEKVIQTHDQNPDSTIRVNLERLDQLLNLMGEVMVYQNDNERGIAGLAALRDKSEEMQILLANLAGQVEELKTNNSEAMISSISQKLSDAGGTATDLTTKIEAATEGMEQNCASRKLVLDELQDSALSVRMLPVGTIFKTFPRLVRDVANAVGKQTKLEITGEECELDKRILEQIADPLMHLLRNAVHHGIETPEVREAAGKPKEGTIQLSAAQRGDRVEIIVKDDGGGIDPQRVKSHAAGQGMISDQEEMSAAAAYDFIFRPGFSTAESVSDISGRGVGLDVVKHNIEKLEGSVAVSSKLGEGSIFTVRLPVTLAVISGLMVESNQDMFVIPLSYIQEMVALDENNIQSLGGQQGFLMRGLAVPLIDLHKFIGGHTTESNGKKTSVVVIGTDRYRLGLKVGKLLSEQEIVIKSIEGFLPRLPFVAGISIMGSGEAAVVININEIISRAKAGVGNVVPAAANAPIVSKSELRHLILIVEDSLVVRELQKNILESAGYEVETAVDGQDALAHLAKKSFDCVITDVEMPRMNGIDLTAAVRRNEEMKETPVVIVTSLASEQDRRMGLDAGANAYMMKGTYDQKQLLATIEKLVA